MQKENLNFWVGLKIESKFRKISRVKFSKNIDFTDLDYGLHNMQIFSILSLAV